jgi:hypothetical protein
VSNEAERNNVAIAAKNVFLMLPHLQRNTTEGRSYKQESPESLRGFLNQPAKIGL